MRVALRHGAPFQMVDGEEGVAVTPKDHSHLQSLFVSSVLIMWYIENNNCLYSLTFCKWNFSSPETCKAQNREKQTFHGWLCYSYSVERILQPTASTQKEH